MGARVAAVTVSDDGGDSPRTVSLTGTGTWVPQSHEWQLPAQWEQPSRYWEPL
jgi:hypothetical protein